LTVLITAIGVSLFIEFTCQHQKVFGADTKPFPNLIPRRDLNVGGVLINSDDLLVLVVTALLLMAASCATRARRRCARAG
jgi:branched-chain amino acid transport system permease protein